MNEKSLKYLSGSDLVEFLRIVSRERNQVELSEQKSSVAHTFDSSTSCYKNEQKQSHLDFQSSSYDSTTLSFEEEKTDHNIAEEIQTSDRPPVMPTIISTLGSSVKALAIENIIDSKPMEIERYKTLSIDTEESGVGVSRQVEDFTPEFEQRVGNMSPEQHSSTNTIDLSPLVTQIKLMTPNIAAEENTPTNSESLDEPMEHYSSVNDVEQMRLSVENLKEFTAEKNVDDEETQKTENINSWLYRVATERGSLSNIQSEKFEFSNFDITRSVSSEKRKAKRNIGYQIHPSRHLRALKITSASDLPMKSLDIRDSVETMPHFESTGIATASPNNNICINSTRLETGNRLQVGIRAVPIVKATGKMHVQKSICSERVDNLTAHRNSSIKESGKNAWGQINNTPGLSRSSMIIQRKTMTVKEPPTSEIKRRIKVGQLIKCRLSRLTRIQPHIKIIRLADVSENGSSRIMKPENEVH